MGITTVVFDFGNVLGFFSHRKAAEQLAAYGQSVDPAEMHDFVFGSQLSSDYEVGAISSADFRAVVRRRFALTCDDAQFDAAYSDIFVPNVEACTLVPRLNGRYRLQLLSNTTEIHCRWFRRQFADVLSGIVDLIFSHEAALRKPDPRIYEYCRSKAGRPAAECVFIDDVVGNIEGARAAGWHGIVYRPGGTLMDELAALGVTA
jgi:putative hydrolase of the HAD superfamily